uniref:Uncharacterized protein n=1 Tax=Anguilla anguilla TaxID=7936 RepID=A0A0E9TCP7_ANGAN
MLNATVPTLVSGHSYVWKLLTFVIMQNCCNQNAHQCSKIVELTPRITQTCSIT